MPNPMKPEKEDPNRTPSAGAPRVDDPARASDAAAQTARQETQADSLARRGDGASSAAPQGSGGAESRPPPSSARGRSSPAPTAPSTYRARSASSARDDESFETLECVLDCLDALVHEIPRGANAQWKEARDHLGRARALVEGGTRRDSSRSWRTSGSGSRPTMPMPERSTGQDFAALDGGAGT